MRALLVLALATAVTASPAAAKEGVVATLEAPVPLGAAAGDEVALAWTLASVDEEGAEQPFGAQGVYVTLVSSEGGEPTTGYAEGGSNGRYTATAVVPAGGIGGIQIALMGWSNGVPSPVVFPIANNPLPEVAGEALVPSTAADDPAPAAPLPVEPEGGAGTAWIALALAGLLALAALAIVARRRRRPLSSA